MGELCLRSPTQFRGYWRDPEATAATLRDGWVHTGDLALIDDAGCVRLAGRAKEMFIRGGYNVYPLEVEAVLASHPAVAEVVITPRPDPVMGEIGVAVVVPRAGVEPPTARRAARLRRRRGCRPTSCPRPSGSSMPSRSRRCRRSTAGSSPHAKPNVRELLLPGLRSSRVEAFSDGVMAIAITLLILDVKVPLAAWCSASPEPQLEAA